MLLPGYWWVTLVSGLALLTYYFTLLIAGVARVRFKVPAPSHDGPEDYVRRVRAHQNTLEHLVLFLPGMWLFALTVSPIWAAAIGAIWPPARLAYAMGYHRAAEKRRIGIYLSMPPIYIFVLGTIIASIVHLLRH
ncbi:MAPEG family protein [uncultured Sphingomonas sp.]|uniref:MAPEG family protein n=1 Tax=uncultured Sphingomonas sp. TaxID=158754 RepID=UPI00262BBF54|nr:MAPEG family protein [uncultured Sphingomonas sp.]